MTRKYILSFLIMIIFFSLLSFDVNAESNNNIEKNKQIVYQAEEIKDLDKLYKKAIAEEKLKIKKTGHETKISKKVYDSKSISGDFIEGSPIEPKAYLENDGKAVEVDVISTTQLLQTTIDGDIEENHYAETTFALPTIEDNNALEEDSYTASTTYSHTGSKTDSTISVRAHATIYYTTTTVAGYASVKLSRATASWTLLDSQMYLENRRVQLAAQGTNNGYYLNQVDIYRYANTNSTGTYYAPSSWQPVARYINTFNVGINTFVDLRRGTSKSTLSFYHRIK